MVRRAKGGDTNREERRLDELDRAQAQNTRSKKGGKETSALFFFFFVFSLFVMTRRDRYAWSESFEFLSRQCAVAPSCSRHLFPHAAGRRSSNDARSCINSA